MIRRYSVTFEFQDAAPITHTGIVAGFSMATIAARAARAAIKAHPGLRWSSAVIVLMERVPNAPAPAGETARQ